MKTSAVAPNWRLGVDIGTASCALFGFALNESGERVPCWHDLVIFGEPVRPKTMELKNEVRRRARLQRRQIARRRQRIEKLLHLARMLGVDPADLRATFAALGKGDRFWKLRASAIARPLSMAELFLVLLHIAKHRGYNGRAPQPKGKDKELGKVGAGIERSQRLMQETGQPTLASALWARREADATEPLRKLSESGTYVLRSDVRHEFDLILDRQSQPDALPVLNETLAEAFGEDFAAKVVSGKSRYFWDRKPVTVREALAETIFYQRPLGDWTAKVGTCSLLPPEPRVVAAHPAFQRFRIVKLLGDLRWGDAEGATLTPAQRAIIAALLRVQGSVAFNRIYDELQEAGCMPLGGSRQLNWHTPRREKLVGDTTRASLRSLGLLADFDRLDDAAQGGAIQALADIVRAPEAWRTSTEQRAQVVAGYGEAAAAFIDALEDASIERHGAFRRLSALAEFATQRVAYGVTALRTLADCMEANACDEKAARQALYPHAEVAAKASGTLPPLDPELIRSPVVRRALTETHRMIDRAVRKLGPPQSMVVELAREMKKTLEERAKIEREQRRNERKAEEAAAELAKANTAITGDNKRRWRLWKSQAEHCPYCSQRIDYEEAFDGLHTNLDHIVPRKHRSVGNRLDEVVLAHTRCNSAKGDLTPWQAAEAGRFDWTVVTGAVEMIVAHSGDFKAKSELVLTRVRPGEAPDDAKFLQRQLQETAWIGRVVHAWCKNLTDDVTVVRGALTSELRHAWGLDTVLPELREAEGKHASAKARKLFFRPHPVRAGQVFDKRSDHRQHLIDAAVVALSDRRAYQAAIRARHSRNRGAQRQRAKCPVPQLRDTLLATLRSYEVWHKPDRWLDGEIFDAEPFGLGRDGAALVKRDRASGERRVDKRGFNPRLDKLQRARDRAGREHTKVLRSSETACFWLHDGVLEPISLARFRAEFVGKDARPLLPPRGKFFFKNDLIYLPRRGRLYVVKQLKADDGLAMLPTTETRTFDELKGTGLTALTRRIDELQDAHVLTHQSQLARLVAARSAVADDAP